MSTLANFVTFLQGLVSNPVTAPIARVAIAASKDVVTTTEAAVPTLITHEADVIAAHNVHHPEVQMLSEFGAVLAQALFAAYVAPSPTTPPAVPAYAQAA
jgi:hypothetical protein